MNDEENIEEEVNIPKISFKVAVVLAMITLFILGFGAGKIMGYREAYAYVDSWYIEHIEQNCFCDDIVRENKYINTSANFLGGFVLEIEN